MDYKTQILNKLENKTAVIGIYGLGYVGLPLMLRFVEAGFKVVGFDIDQAKVDQLNDGGSYIERITSDSIEKARNDGFQATTDFSRTHDVDALIFCVPTPLGKHNDPDLSYVISTVESSLPYVRNGQILSLESTTYPGTTEEELQTRIESRQKVVGEDIFLVYSPEREDPGNQNYSTRTIPKVCGGQTASCLEVGVALYEKVIDQVVPVSSTKTAEMTKLLENIYRAVNIGLVNELKVVADKMDIDIHEVIRAAATKPFGFVPFYPGPGLGGHCIPIDPFYLTWKAKEMGVNTSFIELAGEVNSQMPYFVIAKIGMALNEQGKSIKNARILVLGIAYKKNIDDSRESPSLLIIDELHKLGAIVSYSDPHVPVFPKTRKYNYQMNSVSLKKQSLEDSDVVVLLTDHDLFDLAQIENYARLIIDTRGVFPRDSAKVVPA